ncbi:MAG: DsrE family protein [Bacteroidales bacterium]|nr:DsrE family protein [Bacteroidales bacterium]
MRRLILLWTTGERETALKMIIPYAKNSLLQGWWEEVTLIVWGASTKLVAEDIELQRQIAELSEHGIRLESCKWCADQFNVSEKMIELGFDNKYMGEVLTEYLQRDEKVLTF